MKIIGDKLGWDKKNKITKNSRYYLDSILEQVGISYVPKDVYEKNRNFQKSLYSFYDHEFFLKLFLRLQGYNLVKIFTRDIEFKRYVKKHGIKEDIISGEILIGKIFDSDKILIINGIVLATDIETVNEKVLKILKK